MRTAAPLAPPPQICAPRLLLVLVQIAQQPKAQLLCCWPQRGRLRQGSIPLLQASVDHALLQRPVQYTTIYAGIRICRLAWRPPACGHPCNEIHHQREILKPQPICVARSVLYLSPAFHIIVLLLSLRE